MNFRFLWLLGLHWKQYRIYKKVHHIAVWVMTAPVQVGVCHMLPALKVEAIYYREKFLNAYHYTWHYKPEVHQINLHRLQNLRSCIVSWLVCYLAFLRGSREEDIYFADRDWDDSSIDMDFRNTCCEDSNNLRWCVCYHTVTWLFQYLHSPCFSNHSL